MPGESIDARLYSHEGVYHVIAVNHEYRSVNATTFTIQSQSPILTRIGDLNVLFENREIQTKEDSWTDDFAPYEVHLYAIRPK